MDKIEYWVGPTSYLDRARKRLLENSHEALFYAAYEARCAVEARQDEYLKAQEEYTASIPKAWRIRAQGVELERIFASNRIQRIEWQFDQARSFVAYHVPVTQSLRDQVDKLNDLLHAQLRARKFYDRWWQKARERVIAVYRGAWMACQGRLLNPMLLGKDKDNKLIGKISLIADTPEAHEFARWQKLGEQVMIHVSYLDAPPADWKLEQLD